MLLKKFFFNPYSFLIFLWFQISPFTQSLGQTTPLALPSDEPRVDLSSPYHSIRTHLDFLDTENYYPDSSARAFFYPGVSPNRAREAAIKFKQVLDGRGLLIDPERIPRNHDFTDTITGNRIFTPISQYPDIYLIRKQGTWTYSQHSIKAIDKLHNEVFPFGIDRFLEKLPHSGTRQFIGLFFWQYLGILLIILLSFLLHKLFTYIFSRLLFRGASHMGYDRLVRPYLLPVAKPLSLFMVFVFIGIVFPILQLPVEISKYFIFAFKAILPFFATFVVFRLVDVFALYLEKLAGKSDSNLENNVVPLIRKVLRVFVIIIGVLVILQSIGVNITALLAGISIGGLALALAAQDTLKNLFGSLMIFIDKPFSVGHWITSGDIDGTVEEVGFRSTRVRTFRNSLTYVPNGKLADSNIDNHGLRKYRRLKMHIALTYDTPPDLIEVFVEGLRKIVDRHPNTRKDFYIIEFNEMGDFALKILFYIFFAVPTWPEELKARHEVLIEIVRLAEKLGVRFAFPTQTLHMENFPEKRSQTPQYDMDMNEFRKVMEDYFKESQP
jgi:MscS family membrane protein